MSDKLPDFQVVLILAWFSDYSNGKNVLQYNLNVYKFYIATSCYSTS